MDDYALVLAILSLGLNLFLGFLFFLHTKRQVENDRLDDRIIIRLDHRVAALERNNIVNMAFRTAP